MESNIENTNISEANLKLEKAREWLWDAHDKEFNYLKDALGEEDYNKHKEDWVKNELENCQDTEDLNEVLENRTEELRQAYIDSVTGLERRERLFMKMDKKLEIIFGFTEKNSDTDKLNKIIDDNRDFKDSNLSVMAGDISFLSLVNVEGHRTGDKLLKNYGDLLLKSAIKGYRHGGDEVTAMFDIPEKEAEAEIEEIKNKVKELKNIKILRDHGLEPNLDTGTAHLREAIKVFGELAKDQGAKEALLKKNPVKEFENIWLEIADKRSQINKGRTRINLLLDRLNDKKSYQKLVGFLRKGGYNITDEEIFDLADKAENKKEEEINNFINKKEEEIIQGKEGYDKLRAKTINKII